jgi:hypothetical protein
VCIHVEFVQVYVLHFQVSFMLIRCTVMSIVMAVCLLLMSNTNDDFQIHFCVNRYLGKSVKVCKREVS